MQNLIRFKDSRVVRLAISAAAVVAVVAGTAGIAAGKQEGVKLPTLKHGVVAILGTSGDDRIALRLKAGQPGILQVDFGDNGSADASFDLADVDVITLNAVAGDDQVRIDESNGAFPAGISTTIRGGAGDDTLTGGSRAETFRGGAGDDRVDGNAGADVGLMGAGDDVFIWDPGDGSDVVEGEAGLDTMLFNGAGGPEQVDLSANGNRLKFFRVQANITMDTDGVERVDFNALGGADTVTIHDLAATDVTAVNVDLALALGGAAGDNAADRVVVEGTGGVDSIDVSGDAGGVKVSGLAATVGILHAEAANDKLDIATLAGDDIVDSGGLAAGVIQLTVVP